jgi:heme A synthase
MSSSTVKSNRFAVYAWAVLAFNLLVIVWGAYVRATGAGAGCGDHWPLCNGEVVPRAPEVKTVVEFTHRLTSGLALLLVVGLVVWARRAYPKGHAVRRGAALSLVFIIVEALIGAGLVLLQLVADNATVVRAAYLSVHLVNTFVLVAVLALTAWWASGEAATWGRGRGALRWHAWGVLLATLALSVSGAVAALGATLFPGSAAEEFLRGDLTPSARLMFGLRQYSLHPLLAVLVGGYVVAFAVRARRGSADAWVSRWSAAAVALVLAQLALGVLNVVLLAPVWLQLVHLLLADLLWLALVLLASAALAEREVRAAEFEPARLSAAEV